jgi:hypothetical protein
VAKRRAPAKPDPVETPSGVTLALPAEGLGSSTYWAEQLEQSETRIKTEIPQWREDLKRYAGAKPTLWGIKTQETISPNVQFYTVEQKRPQLFYQTPYVQVQSIRTETDQAAPQVEQLVNALLGRTHINAERLVESALNDCLIEAGIGPTKIGYDQVSVDVAMPTGRIDPMTGQPAIDPQTGQPEATVVPKVIWARYYWERFSPADLRLPAGFTTTDYEKAPWIGFRFALSPDQIASMDGNGPGSVGQDAQDLTLVNEQDRRFLTSVSHGIEIWYKASLYDSTIKNPDLMRQLVIVPQAKRHGGPQVLVHRDSPYQRFDANGKFTAGMVGFPIHPLTLRSMPDSAYPPSDCRILRDVADEKAMGRSQMVQQRRRNLPIRGADKTRMRKEDLQRIERGEVQSLVLFDGPITPDVFQQLAQATFPRENFEFDKITQQDIDRLAASGANQQGLPNQDSNTATEASLIQRASDTRMAKERERVLTWFIGGVEKVMALVQLFMDQSQLEDILGPQQAQQLATWDKAIQGRYAFALKPDSSVRIDAAEDRDKYLRLFNLIANHPQANGGELLKMLIEKWELDPAKLVNQNPPQPQPDKPKITVSLKGDDLSPLAPQYVNVIEILKQNGVENLAPATPPQTNALIRSPQPVQPVNQHDANLTGQRSGPAPLQ